MIGTSFQNAIESQRKACKALVIWDFRFDVKIAIRSANLGSAEVRIEGGSIPKPSWKENEFLEGFRALLSRHNVFLKPSERGENLLRKKMLSHPLSLSPL